MGLRVWRKPIIIKKLYKDIMTNCEEWLETEIGDASRVVYK